MPDDDIVGRRASDRYPGPEAVGVLLVQLARDIAEIKADLKEGFRNVGDIQKEHAIRIDALEKFRVRFEERSDALAKDEGNLKVRLPVVAVGLSALAILVTIVTLVVTHG